MTATGMWRLPVVARVLVFAAWSLSGSATSRGEEFELALLNRTYAGFVEELEPIEIGIAHVELALPEHSLTIFSHRAVLLPDDAGHHLATVEIEIAARGRIEADITLGKLKSHVGDDLLVPRQRIVLSGRLELVRGDGGYVVIPLEMPATVEVRIESQLAKRLFGLCHQLVLVLVNMDCVTLERALTRVSVPLPEPGGNYLIPDEELRAEDRQALDAYLAGAASNP